MFVFARGCYYFQNIKCLRNQYDLVVFYDILELLTLVVVKLTASPIFKHHKLLCKDTPSAFIYFGCKKEGHKIVEVEY